jgi:hypothetical protein
MGKKLGETMGGKTVKVTGVLSIRDKENGWLLKSLQSIKIKLLKTPDN